jgi:hypothetical protein
MLTLTPKKKTRKKPNLRNFGRKNRKNRTMSKTRSYIALDPSRWRLLAVGFEPLQWELLYTLDNKT